MEQIANFKLSYKGYESDRHQIDLYDVAQALIGFQRSIALTTHLVLSGEIITQSPSLRGAKILTTPANKGSWEIIATILAGGYAIGTAPKDTPLGHIVHSVYDYIVSESLGVHVDYDKTIGAILDEKKELKQHLALHKLDALTEKCSTAISDIHRPIYKTHTAEHAKITSDVLGRQTQVGSEFSLETYSYIHEHFAEDRPVVVKGRISSYNSNTFKGRIYVAREGRPVVFELSKECRSNYVVGLVTASLSASALKDYTNEWCEVYCLAFRNVSRSGQLKSYKIVQVSHEFIE